MRDLLAIAKFLVTELTVQRIIILLDLGLPNFHTVLFNGCAVLNRSWCSCHNRVVSNVTETARIAI